MTPILDLAIDERTTPSVLERIRRNLATAVRELQRLWSATAKVAKTDLVLADGIPTAIPHGLGRKAFVWVSPPRGASSSGRIEEVRDGAYDPTKYVVIKATGYGGPITVDVAVS